MQLSEQLRCMGARCLTITAGALLLTLVACLDQIELKQPERPEAGLVIQGRIILGNPTEVSVYLSRQFVYTTNLPEPIRQSNLLVRNEAGQEWALTSSLDGWYRASIPAGDPRFAVAAGGRYQLLVNMLDGEKYESDWEIILPVPAADSVQATFAEEETINADGEPELQQRAKFAVSTPLLLDGERVRLRWELLETFRVTDNLGAVCYFAYPAGAASLLLFDATRTPADYLLNNPLFNKRNDSKLAEGYYLTVYQQRLDAGAYRYFEQANFLLTQQGSIFDPPPGVLPTNLRSITTPDALVYGYFYAAAQDTLRRYVSPAEAGFPTLNCPLPPPVTGETPPPNVCDDCILGQGASRLKPVYWIH